MFLASFLAFLEMHLYFAHVCSSASMAASSEAAARPLIARLAAAAKGLQPAAAAASSTGQQRPAALSPANAVEVKQEPSATPETIAFVQVVH